MKGIAAVLLLVTQSAWAGWIEVAIFDPAGDTVGSELAPDVTSIFLTADTGTGDWWLTANTTSAQPWVSDLDYFLAFNLINFDDGVDSEGFPDFSFATGEIVFGPQRSTSTSLMFSDNDPALMGWDVGDLVSTNGPRFNSGAGFDVSGGDSLSGVSTTVQVSVPEPGTVRFVGIRSADYFDVASWFQLPNQRLEYQLIASLNWRYLATNDDLRHMKSAWEAWGRSPSAYFAFPWCRAIGRRG